MDDNFSFLKKISPEPSNLIKGLQAIQAQEGYVSNEAINAAAEYFAIPPVEVEGVLSFYAQFKRVKPGKYQIAVCDGTACHIKGAPLVHEWLKQELGFGCAGTGRLDSLQSNGATKNHFINRRQQC